jgi:hypothetical protein
VFSEKVLKVVVVIYTCRVHLSDLPIKYNNRPRTFPYPTLTMNLTQHLMTLALLAFASLTQVLGGLLGPSNGRANVSAAPADESKHLERASPIIGAGFTQPEQVQIPVGVRDACTLAVAAIKEVRICHVADKFMPYSVS